MIFLFASVIIFNLIAFLIPKRITWNEIYATGLFAILLALVADIVLDLKYHLYGFFTAGLQLATLIGHFGLYPAASTIILNYFPYKKGLRQKIFYILICTILIIVYEWLALQSEFFYYNQWKLWYSALCYPFIISILALNLHFIRRINMKKQDTE